MDTLAQILHGARARSPMIADLRLGGEVSLGLPALGGLPIHYIVSGACRLDTGLERVDLAAGDLVMLARLPHYRLETTGGGQRVEVMDFAERDSFSIDGLRTGRNQLLTRAVGEGPVRARVFSAILMPGGRDDSPLIRDLPVVTLLRDVKSLLETWLIAALDFMAAELLELQPGFSAIAERLIEVTYEALMIGVGQVRPGATTGDIGAAIQDYAEGERCSIVREFCGHGVGRLFHDEPNILHYGRSGEGVVLRP